MADNKYPEMDYFMNESMSDIWFVIDGQRLPANKTILSFRNKVFRAMFSENFKESKDKEVVIEDTTYEAFKTMIHFFHSEQLDFKDGNDLKLIYEVLQLSDRYEAYRLIDKLVEHMEKIRFTFDNIELISRIANGSQNKQLIEKVMTFVDQNLKDFTTKHSNKLIAINDFTHNHLLKTLVNNYLEVKPEPRPETMSVPWKYPKQI